jgi:hypothetical protein
MWYVYTVECYSAIKKNEIVSYRKIDETGNHHFKPNKTDEKDKYYMFFVLC